MAHKQNRNVTPSSFIKLLGESNVKRNRNGEGEGEAAHLPEEIVREILLKLPVRSLLRFKSVHKQWRSLISDPHFGKQHHQTMAAANRRVCAVFRSRPSRVSLSSVYLPSPDDEGKGGGDIEVVQAQLHCPFSDKLLLFVGSANGLLFAWNLLQAIVFLWNPSTGEYKEFPQPSRILLSYITRETVFGGGTKISGFGYDSITDEYKAVIFLKSRVVPYIIQMFLFTSKTGLWTDTKYCHGYPYFTTSSAPAVTINNGSPHWVVQQNDGNGKLVLLFFDWAEERLKEVPVHDSLLIHNNVFKIDLADFGGCISVADSSSDSSIDVWVMKEHGVKDSWTKLFVIPKFDPNDYLIPLGFAKDGEEVLLLFNNQRLVTHSLKTGAEFLLSSVRPRKHDRPFCLEDVVISCMESLISPNGAEAAGH